MKKIFTQNFKSVWIKNLVGASFKNSSDLFTNRQFLFRFKFLKNYLARIGFEHRKLWLGLKFFFFSTLFLTFLSGQLHAKPRGLYGGIDLQYNDFSFDNSNPVLSDGTVAYKMTRELFPRQVLSPNFYVGFDNQKNFKIELDYGFGSQSKSNNATGLGANAKGDIGRYSGKYPLNYKTENKIELSYFSLDFKPYTMLDEITAFYVIIGLGHYNIRLQEQNFYTINSVEKRSFNTNSVSKFAPSLGLGLEFQLFESFFARAQAKYTNLDISIPGSGVVGTVNIRNLISANVGFGYKL